MVTGKAAAFGSLVNQLFRFITDTIHNNATIAAGIFFVV